MQNMIKTVLSLAKNAAEKSMHRDANRTSCGVIFQPKVPNEMKQFKKSETK